MNIVTFDTPTGELNGSLFLFSDEPFLTVPGKLFEAGEYAAKGFSLTPEEAAKEAARFNALGKPAQMNYEHKPGILDGQLGQIKRIWTQGTELWADFIVPKWLAAHAKAKNIPLKVSAEFEKNTKHLRAAAWTLNPHIKDAQLVAFHAEVQMRPALSTTPTPWKGTPMTAVKERQDRIAAIIAAAASAGRELTTDEVLAAFSEDTNRLQQLEAENKRLKQSETEKAAAAFADDAIRVQKRAFPSERAALIAQFTQAAEDDAERSVVVKVSVGTEERSGGRVDLLKNAIALRPQHNLDKELLDPDTDGKVLAERFGKAKVIFSEQTTEGTDGKTPDDKEPSEERINALLSLTSEGQKILAEKTGKGN